MHVALFMLCHPQLRDQIPLSAAMRLSLVLWLALWSPCAQTLKKRTRAKLVPRVLEPPQGCLNTMDLYNFTLHTEPQRLYMADLDGIIYNNAEYWTQMTLKADKCRGGISSNTCEYFGKWKWSTAICSLVGAQGVPWTPVVAGISPSVGCPFKAGRYELRNITLHMDSAGLFVGQEIMYVVWLVEFQMFDERGNLHFCAKFKADVVRIRVPVDE